MSLVFENGTGVPDANTYVNLPYVENYFTGDRLSKFNELENKDEIVIAATQFIDISFDWKGSRKTLEQGLNFPRMDVELDGFIIEGVAVKKATCEAIWLVMTEKRLFNNKSDRTIASESIGGAVSVSYFDPKDRENVATRFEVLNRLLRGLFKTENEKKGGSNIGSASVIRA